jgi:hypothetical protein
MDTVNRHPPPTRSALPLRGSLVHCGAPARKRSAHRRVPRLGGLRVIIYTWFLRGGGASALRAPLPLPLPCFGSGPVVAAPSTRWVRASRSTARGLLHSGRQAYLVSGFAAVPTPRLHIHRDRRVGCATPPAAVSASLCARPGFPLARPLARSARGRSLRSLPGHRPQPPGNAGGLPCFLRGARALLPAPARCQGFARSAPGCARP